MSSWYKRAQEDISDYSPYSSKEDSRQCIFRGIRFSFDDMGILYDAEILDAKDIDYYIEPMADDFFNELEKAVNSRLTNFGIIDDLITIDFNGLRVSVRNPSDESSATIEKATVINIEKFLDSLPNFITEAIDEKVKKAFVD
jgi:hypothetical protein